METGSYWTVEFTTKAGKQLRLLKEQHLEIYKAAMTLAKEIEEYGPIRKNRPNFGPLHKQHGIPDSSYHCHIKKGKPTYVACWNIENKTIKIVEIYYVGTHEKAPY